MVGAEIFQDDWTLFFVWTRPLDLFVLDKGEQESDLPFALNRSIPQTGQSSQREFDLLNNNYRNGIRSSFLFYGIKANNSSNVHYSFVLLEIRS